MISLNQKIIVLIIILAVSMFFWITRTDSATLRIISLLMISVVSYWIGRLHEKKINLGEIRAVGMDSEIPNPPNLK